MDTGTAGVAHRPVAPLIGAEVALDKAALLSGAHATALRALLAERGVLVFPGVAFTEEEQVAFTRTLGTYAPDRDDEGTTAIALDAGAANADYTRASFFWHFDGYMNEKPVLASILCARVLPETGGDTEFANTCAAYDALPDDRKRQIAGLHAVHALAGAQRSVDPEPDYATFSRWRTVCPATLPLVWTHRCGRKSLVVGNTAVGIIGMDPLESLDLLVWLRDWATHEQFRYRHRWRAGDAVMWDNTATLHRATPYPPGSGRLLTRTKLQGEEAVC